MKNRLLQKTSAVLLLFALLLSWGGGALAAPADDPAADPNAERLLNWEATGPLGGDVRSLVIDPQDPRRLYFGTIDGQMYTYADTVETW